MGARSTSTPNPTQPNPTPPRPRGTVSGLRRDRRGRSGPWPRCKNYTIFSFCFIHSFVNGLMPLRAICLLYVATRGQSGSSRFPRLSLCHSFVKEGSYPELCTDEGDGISCFVFLCLTVLFLYDTSVVGVRCATQQKKRAPSDRM